MRRGCFRAVSWSVRRTTRWRSGSSRPTIIPTTTRSRRSGGVKISANASRHSALSYEHAGKNEAQLTAEVADLMAKAEAADAADIPDGMSIPDELVRREERLRKLAEARAKIEARAKERQGGDRTSDRHGPSAAPSAVGRALRSGAGSAARSNAGRGDGASAEDEGRPGALRVAQADPGAGVRHHQIDAGIPSIFAARPRGRARRMEPRHHGLEHQAAIRPRPGLTRLRRPARQAGPSGTADLRPTNRFLCTNPT